MCDGHVVHHTLSIHKPYFEEATIHSQQRACVVAEKAVVDHQLQLSGTSASDVTNVHSWRVVTVAMDRQSRRKGRSQQTPRWVLHLARLGGKGVATDTKDTNNMLKCE